MATERPASSPDAQRRDAVTPTSRQAVTPAQDRVARSLLMDGPATPPELASRLEITSAGVRRHLDALVSFGYVTAGDRPAYGPTPIRGRGRPPKIYSLTESGRGVFDQAYDDLALSALRFLEDQAGPQAVSAFARQRGEDLEQRYAGTVAGAGPQVAGKVRALVDALTEDGFAATVVDDGAGAGIQICQHNCPVAHVAEQYPALCEQEAAAMQRLLGANVVRLATIAHGDGVCTAIVNRGINQSEGLPRTTESTSESSRKGTV